MDFTIVNPITGGVLLRAETEGNDWLNRWMEPESYEKYHLANVGKVPSSHTGYEMVFTVAGRTRKWAGGQVTALPSPVASPAKAA
jgi:hypothetical protein